MVVAKDQKKTQGIELVLVRHGEAVSLEEKGLSDDFDRPLTPRGKEQALWAGRELKSDFDLILVSSACRTRETWQIMSSFVACTNPPHFEKSAYLAGRKALRDLLHKIIGKQPIKRVLVIGHNPGISHLLQNLSGHDQGLSTADAGVLHLESSVDWETALHSESLWKLAKYLQNPR